MRRLLIVCSILVGGSLVGSAALAATTAVIDDPHVDERDPSTSDDYIVWTANSESRPFHYNSFVRPHGGGPRVRVNPLGTQSFYSSIDGSTVVYQQDEGGGDADLRFFDAESGIAGPMPDGVNSRNLEEDPTLSGDWLLYTWTNVNHVGFADARRKVILFNLATVHRRVLVDVPWTRSYVVAGQVSGDWATFDSCRFDFQAFRYYECDVVRYRISTGRAVRLPNPGRQQYAGSVTSDGTVYFVRTAGSTHWRCGAESKILRYPVGGRTELVGDLPDGRDALATFAFEEANDSTVLSFQRLNCGTGLGGIYRIENADSA